MTVRKVCVIGGTGFVGRHLCCELSRRRLQIRVLTRRRERRRPSPRDAHRDVVGAGGCRSCKNDGRRGKGCSEMHVSLPLSDPDRSGAASTVPRIAALFFACGSVRLPARATAWPATGRAFKMNGPLCVSYPRSSSPPAGDQRPIRHTGI